MVGCDGKLNMMHFKICTELDGREELLVLKFDSFQKHASRRKCRLHIPNLLWGNILCLLIVSMPRMNGCGLARVKILLLK